MSGTVSGARAESLLKSPSPDHLVYLLCCDDDGVLDAALSRLVASLSKRGEPVERQRLDEDVVKSRDDFTDILLAQPLLGPRPVLFFRLPNERLSQAIQKGLSAAHETAPGEHNPVVLLAGKLKKTSSLRKFVDSHTCGIVADLASPTQQDREQSARERLDSEGVTFEGDALEAFLTGLPENQALADMETEKLCLFARNLGRRVNREDITELTSVEGDAALFELVQAILAGKTVVAATCIEQLFVSGVQPFAVIRALDREFARMVDAHTRIGSGEPAKTVGRTLSPPVFDWAWSRFETQLKTWSARRAIRASEILADGEAQLRRAGHLGHAVASRIVIQLSEAVGQ